MLQTVAYPSVGPRLLSAFHAFARAQPCAFAAPSAIVEIYTEGCEFIPLLADKTLRLRLRDLRPTIGKAGCR